ncbi:MAG: protein-glutamate O-methyltransferase CheR [Planctomycetota bacterium]|nr:protein-glutamate O-methyltransferase CheR [Planctomycetota bacterium]
MWPHSESIPLPATVFTILRDLIHERAGIFYENDKRELLADKLSSRVMDGGFGSFLDYYYLLKYGPDAEPEWSQVLDALSVPETYFYRETGQINALITEILPAYVAACPGQLVQIWCAACATGEEPLTIAMALLEADWFERVPIKIIASDASPAAITKAQDGVYRERSFRTTPKALRDKYFTAVSGGWKIAPEVSSRVEFAIANLMNLDQINHFARSPFVFCRNVFIYFSSEAIVQTVKHFARKMKRPGYLFVGASESLLKLSTDFELQAAGEGFVYQLK